MQRIITAMLDNDDSASLKDRQYQGMALARLLNGTEIAIANAQDRTRSIIVDSVREALGSLAQANSEGTSEVNPELTIRKMRYALELEARAKLNVEKTLLRSLEFATMTDRQEEIAHAHAKTCQWIFGEHKQDVPWANFVEWLRSDQSVYWVNGKAGSGKSTLMRYISKHPQTHQLLSEWANPLPATIASFYFWPFTLISVGSQNLVAISTPSKNGV